MLPETIRRNLNRNRRVLQRAQTERMQSATATPAPDQFPSDPCGYASKVLKVEWWGKQREIAEALLKPPHRVLVKASHGVGKSHLAGGIVNWFYDSFDPSAGMTTAPTARQVRDVLWKEVRRQRRGRPGFSGPKIPRLESSAFHFAHGFTARDSTAFQGQHEESILIIFDEAVGVGREFWEAAESMMQGARAFWLAIFNPTDTSSAAYQEEQEALESGRWHVIDIPATSHPNIAAELDGREPPYPQAIRLGWLNDKVAKWCDPLKLGDQLATDIEWPPKSGKWWRPGPLAQARLLARWPSIASGVWSDALWAAAEAARLETGAETLLPEIGCDVARFGDDWTEIVVRCGPVALHHEAHNGWDTAQTTGRLKELCREWAAWASRHRPPQAAAIKPEQILVKIDDDGVGSGVVDHAAGWNWVGLSAASKAVDTEDYPNRRSELWFATADRARRGELDVSQLSAESRRELKRQAMAPKWKLDNAGRRVVEKKDDTKDTLGRSPDGMDALNLAYAPAAADDVAAFVPEQPRQNWRDRQRRS